MRYCLINNDGGFGKIFSAILQDYNVDDYQILHFALQDSMCVNINPVRLRPLDPCQKIIEYDRVNCNDTLKQRLVENVVLSY